MNNSHPPLHANGLHRQVIEIIRTNSDEIVEKWVAESSKLPFARPSEFHATSEVRADRMRNFISALLEREEAPGSKKAGELLRSVIRAEQFRALNLSQLIADKRLLKDVISEVLDRELGHDKHEEARRYVNLVIDRSVIEMVRVLEQSIETQNSLVRCLSCTPTQRTELEHVLSRFCKSAMDYFDADFVGLFKYAEESKELVCTACAAKGVSLSKDSRILVESYTVAGEALQTKRPVVHGPATGGAVKRRALGGLAFEHCISIPMVSDGRVVGLLMVADSSRVTTFAQDDVSIAEDLSEQIARVLANAEVFEELSIRSRAQKSLIQTAADLQLEIESEEIYRIVATKLAELIPCNELAFYMLDWKKGVGNPVYATGPYAAETMADRNFDVSLGFVGHVARTKKAEIIMDTEADARGEYIPGTPATHSRMLAVPLIGRKEVLGVIELLKYPPDVFTHEDLEIATMFANHASVAIENARLLKEITSARDQIELHMDLLTHDIANYTTPISAYLDALRNKKTLDSDTRAVLDKVQLQVENIMRMVAMVRTITRLREGKPSKFRRCDLGRAIESSLSKLKEVVPSGQVEWDLTLPPAKMFVNADDTLEEMFLHLFFAVEKSERRSATKVRVSSEVLKDGRTEYWLVKVAHPGRSIPDNMKTEVLHLSKRAKSELVGGLGIGLATARNIAEHLRGEMWITDMDRGNPSTGCVYNISIPIAK